MTNGTNILHKELSYGIVGCVYEVRNTFGSGQKEIVYQNALSEVLERHRLSYRREVSITIRSPETGKPMGTYVLDFVVDEKVIIEVKAIRFTPRKIEQQLYGYLKSTPYEVGYLVNFGSPSLYLKRVIFTNERKHISHSFNS